MSVILLELFQRFLGEYRNHSESSGQVSFNCPACAEDKGLINGDGKYKLAVNYNKGIFKCWVCKFQNHMHGTLPNLIKRYGNNEILKEYRRLKPDNDYSVNQQDAIPTIITPPKGFKKISEINQYYPKYWMAYNYLTKERGLTDEIINSHNIGYTLEGLYRNRIIIPSYDEFGDWNFFVARSWDRKVTPKYLNPDAEKSLIVFNENKINWDATIYLVEGGFDHVVIPNSIPLLGKFISPKLISLLYTNARADIVILLDGDAYPDAILLYKELNFGILYNRIKVCVPPPTYDPSGIYEKLGYNGIVKLLKNTKQLEENLIY